MLLPLRRRELTRARCFQWSLVGHQMRTGIVHHRHASIGLTELRIMDKAPGKPVQYLAKEASPLTGQPEFASSIVRCEMANCRGPVSASIMFHQWSRKARASRTIRDSRRPHTAQVELTKR